VGKRNFVVWAGPSFKDRRKFSQIANPFLQACYPMRGFIPSLGCGSNVCPGCFLDQNPEDKLYLMSIYGELVKIVAVGCEAANALICLPKIVSRGPI